jgi:hypothetical protein
MDTKIRARVQLFVGTLRQMLMNDRLLSINLQEPTIAPADTAKVASPLPPSPIINRSERGWLFVAWYLVTCA